MKPFGRWLLQQMNEAGIDAPELARRIGIRKQSVYGWIEGGSPRRGNIERIAKVLGIPPASVTAALGMPVHYQRGTDPVIDSAADILGEMPERTRRTALRMLQALRESEESEAPRTSEPAKE